MGEAVPLLLISYKSAALLRSLHKSSHVRPQRSRTGFPSIIDLVETRFLTTTRASHHPCDNGFTTTLRLDHRFPPRSWPVGLQ